MLCASSVVSKHANTLQQVCLTFAHTGTALTNPLVYLQPYQQMYSGQAGMVWGAFPSQVAHPYNMNDGQNAAYQQILAQQTLGHPSHLSSYPPGINPAYQTPNYGQQGNQQGAPNQSRGGSSRGGHSSGQGSQGGRGGQQNATPSAAPPAKPSRVLKITNPADGAEVHVEQIKKAEKAAASGTIWHTCWIAVLAVCRPPELAAVCSIQEASGLTDGHRADSRKGVPTVLLHHRSVNI